MKEENKKINLGFLMGIILLISILPIASSVSPFIQTGDKGLIVEYPQIFNLKVNQTHKFYFHIYNSSNGSSLNSSIVCYFHLYNSNGTPLVNLSQNTPERFFDYEFLVLGGNFSTIGDYSYLIQCEHSPSQISGFNSISLEVTEKGVTYDTSKAILFLIAFLGFAGAFGLSLHYAIVIPFKHTKDNGGNVLSVNHLRYVKIFFMVLSYILAMYSFGLIRSITGNFALLEGTAKLFNFLYQVMIRLAYPIIIVGAVALLIDFIRNLNLEKAIKRFGGGRYE